MWNGETGGNLKNSDGARRAAQMGACTKVAGQPFKTRLINKKRKGNGWALGTKEQALAACSAARAISDASKTVSRVLYLTVIYLDAPSPARSSHLPEAVGPTCCFPTVLLRIEFTAADCLQPSGELLPHLSILTVFCQSTEAGNSAFRPRAAPADAARPPWNGKRRRYISVALFLKSPSAGVTRYPCPVEPGLSS